MELAADDRQGQALLTLGERGKERSEKTAAAKFIFALKVFMMTYTMKLIIQLHFRALHGMSGIL